MLTNAAANNSFNIYYLSEQALTLEFGQDISEDLLQKITNFNKLIQQNPFPGFCTTVSAYTSLSVFFNPLAVLKSPDLKGVNCFEKVSDYLLKLKQEQSDELFSESRTITIPVCYDNYFGPDLEEVAKLHHLSPKEVIKLHSQITYKVFMIGFVPGFAYLGGMDDLLETPRKATPRKAIPVGSVGIAGKQTGIYPLETPGGWQLIGRTPLVLFNPKSAQPALLKAGDYITFEPISINEFENYSSKNADTYS